MILTQTRNEKVSKTQIKRGVYVCGALFTKQHTVPKVKIANQFYVAMIKGRFLFRLVQLLDIRHRA